jgi:hypothetical protein
VYTLGRPGKTAMVRHRCAKRDEDRQRFCDGLLSTTVDNFPALSGVLRRVREQGSVVVMGSREAIAKVSAECNRWLKGTEVPSSQ